MKHIYTEIESLLKVPYPLIYLITWEEDRIEKIIKEACDATGKELKMWSSIKGFGSESGREKFVAALDTLDQISKAEAPCVFILKDFHPYFDDFAIRSIRELTPRLEEKSQTVVFLSPVLKIPRELEKDVYILDVPLPKEEEVKGLITKVYESTKPGLNPKEEEKIAKALLGLTIKEMARVLRRAINDGGSSIVDFVLGEKKKIIRSSKILELIEPEETLEDVGGLDNLKEWLDSRGAAFTDEARAYGLPEPKGLFLVGIQGCGKSLVSKAVGRHWGLPILRLSTGNLFASFSDEAEFELRQVMKITESLSPVVLWIDEIEKGFLPLSQGVKQRGGGAFGSFITWLQEKKSPVFVVSTANDIETLPPELIRKGRFDEIFFVDLPNIHERKNIFSIHLAKRRQDLNKIDVDTLAEHSEGYSGAEIEQLIISAMYDGFSSKRKITTSDFLNILRQTVPLSVTMEDQIRELREWAKIHTRAATLDVKRLDMFKT